jgi:hypothetical protein
VIREVFTAIDLIYDPASTQSFLGWFSPAVYIYSSGHILGPPTWQFHKKMSRAKTEEFCHWELNSSTGNKLTAFAVI